MLIDGYKFRETIHRCFRCGYCKFPTTWTDVNNCPPYARYRMEPYSCGGRLWTTRAWLNEVLQWSEHLAEILYSCTTCRNCEIKCPLSFNVDIVNMVIAARAEMVEQGKVPRAVRKFLENVDLYGNPYGISRSKRDDWMKGEELERYKGHEFLYYVGCTGSFDTRAQNSARSLGRALHAAGVNFGILGNDESCDGNEVHKLGEEGLFEVLAEDTIRYYTELGVTKIITLSPHAYHAFRNLYPAFGGKFQVFHYTQVLDELISEGALDVSRGYGASVTYHDPCFLGRWNEEYEAPRRLLKKIPLVEFVEMARNRDAALCCGGGAGNFEMDLLGGSESSPARRRVREAVESGAAVLAVACPKCLVMLEDAVKAEEIEDKIMVKDLAEIVCAACAIG